MRSSSQASRPQNYRTIEDDRSPIYFPFPALNHQFIVETEKTKKVGETIEKVQIKNTIELTTVYKQGDEYVVRFTKSNYYIDKAKNFSKVQELALECAACYYPLDVTVSAYGEIIDIDNVEEVQSRWKKTRAKVLNYYVGDMATKYVEQIDSKINNAELFSKIMQSDFSLQLFFLPFSKGFHDDFLFSSKLFSPQYNFKISQNKTINQDQQTVILQQGKMDESRNYADIILKNKTSQYTDSPLPIVTGQMVNKITLNRFDIPIEIKSKTNIKLNPTFEETYNYKIQLKPKLEE